MGTLKKQLPVLAGRKRWLRRFISNRATSRCYAVKRRPRGLQGGPGRPLPPTAPSRTPPLQRPQICIPRVSKPSEPKPPTLNSQQSDISSYGTKDAPFLSSIVALKMNRENQKLISGSSGKEKVQNFRGRVDAEKSYQKISLLSSKERKFTIHSSQDASHSLQPVRKKVDAETLQYFEEIYSLLGTGTGTQLDSTDERMILIENALEETHGKECELACEKSCSRVLETLVLCSNAQQVASFLHRLSPFFFTVSTNAAGSHVAETLLKSAATILHGHNTEAGWFKILEQAFTLICQVLGERTVDVLSNCYGSHVVRSLLSVLSGVPVQCLQKGSKGGGLSSRLSLSRDPANNVKEGSITFSQPLEFLISRILQAAKERTFQLCMDPFASPVLQALVRVLARDPSNLTKAVGIFLGTDKENVDDKEDKILGQNLRQLMLDNCGSHLVEVMLERAPDDIYEIMFQQILTPYLLEYSTHPSANFVIQALIVSIRKREQVALLLSELKPNFCTLIKGNRSGIITSLLKVCKEYRCNEQEVCSSLVKATNSDAALSPSLVSRFLYLEGYACSNGSKEWKPPFNEKMSVLGCAMLQLIFTYPMESSQLFWLSLLDLEPPEVLATIKDPGGCRVVDSFLSSEIPSKHKNRLIAKLKGHFAELASQLFSAITLEKCFRAGAIDLKEALVSELVAIQANLAKTKHGPHYIQRFDLTGYSKAPEQWRARLIAREGTLKAFADAFNHSKPTMKRSQEDERKTAVSELQLHGNKRRKNSIV